MRRPAGLADTRGSGLAAFIAGIRAVDNHAHPNSTAPADSDYDALPLDGIPPSPWPMRIRPENPEWIAAYRAVYGYAYNDLSAPHLAELRASMQRVVREQGDHFPEWALDRMGTEVMLANRVALGPGQAPPRFRWVSFDDALMLPLDTRAERVTPDRRVLYPLEERLLHRYLKGLGVVRLPPTLDAYVRTIVTPTLERQRQAGPSPWFEAAYPRALGFDDPGIARARASPPGRPSRGRPRTRTKGWRSTCSGHRAVPAPWHGSPHPRFEGGGGPRQVAGSDPFRSRRSATRPAARHDVKSSLRGGGGPRATRHAYLAERVRGFSVNADDVGPDAGRRIARWLARYPSGCCRPTRRPRVRT